MDCARWCNAQKLHVSHLVKSIDGNFLFVSFSLSRRNSIPSPSEWSPSMAVVQKWRQIGNHTQKDDANRGKVQFSTDGLYTGASLSMNRTLSAVHCDRRIVLVWFFFSTNPLNLISTVALIACPKQWPNIEWVLAIVRQSPTHHSLIRYNGTALLPTARRALVEWNVINGLGQRDSASVHPYRRIMLILSCEVLHYFFGIVSVAILLDYVTHCLRDEHFSPSFVLSWN